MERMGNGPIHAAKKIEVVADKNGDFNSDCKQGFTYV